LYPGSNQQGRQGLASVQQYWCQPNFDKIPLVYLGFTVLYAHFFRRLAIFAARWQGGIPGPALQLKYRRPRLAAGRLLSIWR
jgi:hypothetical protein